MIKLHPWALIGLDAKSSLSTNIIKYASRKSGYIIIPSLEIDMNNKDKILSEGIQATLKGGNICYKSSDKRVTNQLFNIIIPPSHLSLPSLLLIQKWVDF